MPKVSVIIPVYGVEKYIERCARSLFEQTLDDIEYLFIDDCTPDKSIEVLKRVLEEYPIRKDRVIIHRMVQNFGQAAVRKWGMQNAKGDYVIHCDSDDWVDTDMYRAMYEKAIEANADIVLCDYCIKKDMNDPGTYKKEPCPVSKDAYLKGVVGRFYTCAVWNKLVRRSLYSDETFIYPTHAMGEDMLLSIQCIAQADIVVKVTSVYYNYYFNCESITKVLDENKVLNNFYQLKHNWDASVFYLDTKNKSSMLTNEILLGKYFVKSMLHPYLHNKKIQTLWRKTYSEVTTKSLLKSNAEIGCVLRYFCARFYIYSIYYKFINIL